MAASTRKIEKSDEEWKSQLSPERYAVLRQKATEAPFTYSHSGDFLYNAEKGTYVCGACGNELFESNTKFDSHSGWPSFYDAKPGAVQFHPDNSLGMERTEVTCAACGSHLGHIFPDAPDQPTGQRYCINSLALEFKKKS